jgi:hypothetical protein
MKQTAVEWYNEQLNLYGDMAFNKEISLGQYHIKKQELLEQAKEMEKEQIIYSNYNGQSVGKKLKDINIHQMKTKAEQYYNETFKSE